MDDFQVAVYLLVLLYSIGVLTILIFFFLSLRRLEWYVKLISIWLDPSSNVLQPIKQTGRSFGVPVLMEEPLVSKDGGMATLTFRVLAAVEEPTSISPNKR